MARENKYSTMFSYLSMLVERGIFNKIKVNFLLVSHMHDHIDQILLLFPVAIIHDVEQIVGISVPPDGMSGAGEEDPV